MSLALIEKCFAQRHKTYLEVGFCDPETDTTLTSGLVPAVLGYERSTRIAYSRFNENVAGRIRLRKAWKNVIPDANALDLSY